MIKFKKLNKGQYSIINNTQLIGYVRNEMSRDGHMIWIAESSQMTTGKEVRVESLSRRDAASALVFKLDRTEDQVEKTPVKVSPQEVRSVNAALYEMKEGGDIKIHNRDPHLIDLIIQELSEMGIPFIKYALSKDYTGIMQGDEEVTV